MQEPKKEDTNYVVQILWGDVKTGMVLAADAVTADGSVFMKKGVVIGDSHIEKIKANKPEFILVKGQKPEKKERKPKPEPSEKPAALNITSESTPIEELPEFKEFAKAYEEKDEELKKYIQAIGDGAEINLDELFSLTDNIMSKLNCKSDVLTFLNHIRATDEHTFTHCNNVALLCNLFGRWLNLDDKDTVILTTAGILHDVGKTVTPPEVLNKKGPLTDEEYKIMKEHTIQGYKILEKQDIPKSVKLAALMHHEKINGLGYPLGIDDKKIDPIAKIVSICDIYDAMTANRIYRPKLCPFEVIRTFETRVYGELDTHFLMIFLQNIAYTYLNSPVVLSDERTGTVAFINKNNLSKPIVKLDDGQVIDLSYDKELSISALN